MVRRLIRETLAWRRETLGQDACDDLWTGGHFRDGLADTAIESTRQSRPSDQAGKGTSHRSSAGRRRNAAAMPSGIVLKRIKPRERDADLLDRDARTFHASVSGLQSDHDLASAEINPRVERGLPPSALNIYGGDDARECCGMAVGAEKREDGDQYDDGVANPARSRLIIYQSRADSLRERTALAVTPYWSNRKSITRAPLAAASRVRVSAPISLR